jgi:hypothetical protein
VQHCISRLLIFAEIVFVIQVGNKKFRMDVKLREVEDEDLRNFRQVILSHNWEKKTDVIIEISTIQEEADINDLLFSFFSQHGIHIEYPYRPSFAFDLALSRISREEAIEKINMALAPKSNYTYCEYPFSEFERKDAARWFLGFFEKPQFYKMPDDGLLWQNEDTSGEFTFDHGPIAIGNDRIGIFYVKNVY